MSSTLNIAKPRRRGFTLVELAVVVVIIGVLAAFGVPRFLQSVERSKASEAFGYLSSVRSAQERYLARQGTYADDISKLDIQAPTPKYFTVGTIAAGTSGDLQDSWTLTLTRIGLVGRLRCLHGDVHRPGLRLDEQHDQQRHQPDCDDQQQHLIAALT